MAPEQPSDRPHRRVEPVVDPLDDPAEDFDAERLVEDDDAVTDDDVISDEDADLPEIPIETPVADRLDQLRSVPLDDDHER